MAAAFLTLIAVPRRVARLGGRFSGPGPGVPDEQSRPSTGNQKALREIRTSGNAVYGTAIPSSPHKLSKLSAAPFQCRRRHEREVIPWRRNGLTSFDVCSWRTGTVSRPAPSSPIPYSVSLAADDPVCANRTEPPWTGLSPVPEIADPWQRLGAWLEHGYPQNTGHHACGVVQPLGVGQSDDARGLTPRSNSASFHRLSNRWRPTFLQSRSVSVPNRDNVNVSVSGRDSVALLGAVLHGTAASRIKVNDKVVSLRIHRTRETITIGMSRNQG